MYWLNKSIEGFLEGRQFGLIGAPIIALMVGAWLVVSIVRDRRRVKRGEPFNIWYLKYPVYPEDRLYQYYVWQRITLSIFGLVMFAVMILGIVALIIWAAFWWHPAKG